MDNSKVLYVEDIASRVKSRKRACTSKITNFAEIFNDDREPTMYQDDSTAEPSFETDSSGSDLDIIFSEDTSKRRQTCYRRPARKSYRHRCAKGITL